VASSDVSKREQQIQITLTQKLRTDETQGVVAASGFISSVG
jgi:hypothetical protein